MSRDRATDHDTRSSPGALVGAAPQRARSSVVSSSTWAATIVTRDATTSNAEAWRWIAERNLLPGSQESVTNPSNAFDKRWRRYRDLVSG